MHKIQIIIVSLALFLGASIVMAVDKKPEPVNKDALMQEYRALSAEEQVLIPAATMQAYNEKEKRKKEIEDIIKPILQAEQAAKDAKGKAVKKN